MAAIDKTYVNKEQLKKAVEWAKNIGVVTLENGHKFKPLDWIESYNDIYNPEFGTKIIKSTYCGIPHIGLTVGYGVIASCHSLEID